MKAFNVLVSSVVALLVVGSCGHAPAETSDSSLALQPAWTEWEKGNVDAAERLAQEQPSSDESRHLFVLVAFVKGEYETAIARYSEIDTSYKWLTDLNEVVVNALLHLARADEAHRFAISRGMDATTLSTLEMRAAYPLQASVDGITVVPFAEHPLTPYFPGFRVELEGKLLTAHLDTGGTFLVMGPERAQRLGIELIDAGVGYHGTRSVPLQIGVARKFRLSSAVLKNVPVTVVPSLQGEQDFVIFGTNVLQQFLATLDYSNQRLILSTRGDAHLSKRHRAMLSDGGVEIPFYMWGDHYMFARGGFGDHKDLNFFIDSGLVSLAQLRQACFLTTAEHYMKWGVDPERAAKSHFEASLPISLGPLVQRDQFFATVQNPTWESFGGVRIDGLISHAFLKEYTWTLDFETHRYTFSQPRPSSP